MNAIAEMWSLLEAGHRRRLPWLCVLSLGMAVGTLAGIAAVLPFFTALAAPHAGKLRADLAVVFVGGIIAGNGINLLGTMLMTRFARDVGNRLHHRLFEFYLESGFEFHVAHDSAALGRNVLYEVSRVSVGLVQNALLLLTATLTTLLIAGSLLYVDRIAGALTVLGFGAIYSLIYRGFRTRLLRHGSSDSVNFQRRIRVVNDGFGAIKELTLLESRDGFVAQFDRCCEQIARTAESTVSMALAPKYALECLTALGLAAIALYSSAMLEDGRPWLAKLTFVGAAAYRLLPALQQIFVAILKIRFDTPAIRTISHDLRSAARSRPDRAAPVSTRVRTAPPAHCIELDTVSFRYGSRGPDAVHDLSLVIPAGRLVGFIGKNGSGKTTTGDILLGLLEPCTGQVRVDGMVLGPANRRAWRSHCAYVPQHPFLIDATIAENIALGEAPARIDIARVRKAARRAGATEFIEALPQRYHAAVGGHGMRLSGGQRQRIGIARALYRDAAFLVLDEATNSLDGLGETALLDTLESLRGSRTIILIAHRLSTIRACDLLFEFEAGTLAATGSVQQFLTGAFGGHVFERTRSASISNPAASTT